MHDGVDLSSAAQIQSYTLNAESHSLYHTENTMYGIDLTFNFF